MLVIIMAGGKGSRISKMFHDIPKPLIPIYGVPVLEREIRMLALQGFYNIIITVSYMADKIIDYFGDGGRLGVKIEYFVEDRPLGNAGALFRLRSKIGEEPFLILNADSVFDVDFIKMANFHNEHHALVTIFTHPNSHPYDSGLIIADKNCCVYKWLDKDDVKPRYYRNRVNAGLHIIDPKVIDFASDEISQNDKVDLDRQILKPLCETRNMYCYDSSEYVKDMGTPERYIGVVKDFEKGIVKSKNLKLKQKAVFLDRDGTINVYKGYLTNIDDFELIEGVDEAIKKINASGYLCIVVTNQPVIARGEITIDVLDEIHMKMETELAKSGAYVDAIYYCPHHPDKGFIGEVSELKVECECRKPKPGLLIKASEEFNIDLTQSYMVGDGENDILAGEAAGCKSILLGRDYKSLLEFADNFRSKVTG